MVTYYVYYTVEVGKNVKADPLRNKEKQIANNKVANDKQVVEKIADQKNLILEMAKNFFFEEKMIF